MVPETFTDQKHLLTILKTVAFNILSVTRLILALTFTASQSSREDGH
jgi:hypothetical protein